MTRRIGWLTTLGLLVALGPEAAQAQYGGAAPPRQPARPGYSAAQNEDPAGPPQRPATGQELPASQPYPAASPGALVPRDPQLARRDPARAPAAPFVLSAEQQADLDWVLKRWEEHGADVKTFECKFTRFDWDPTWRADQPMHILQGEIKYAAPDKGMFRVEGEIVDFQWDQGEAAGGRFVKGQRAEHWICNGKSVFEYDYRQKQLVEHKLPPELWGKAISNSPLPFLFGAKAEQLKERYFLRVETLDRENDQVWLEAHPKYQDDAANFRRATLILTLGTMQPFALEMVLPNGTASTVYQFRNPKLNVVNLLDPLGVFDNNWLHAATPRGWKRVVEEPPPSEARQPTTPGRVR